MNTRQPKERCRGLAKDVLRRPAWTPVHMPAGSLPENREATQICPGLEKNTRSRIEPTHLYSLVRIRRQPNSAPPPLFCGPIQPPRSAVAHVLLEDTNLQDYRGILRLRPHTFSCRSPPPL